jgi:hypothetical protein
VNDTAAYVAVAHVVLGRHGHKVDPDDLWNATVGSLVIDLGGDPDDPPTVMPSGDDSESTPSGGGDGSASVGEK